MEENALKLNDAICEAYDHPDFKTRWYELDTGRKRETRCNMAVNYVACKAFDYTRFQGLRANEMIDLMESSPEWQEIEMYQAQIFANQGKLTISAEKAPKHGHVAVIRPGMPGMSGKWEKTVVPKCMNVGKDTFIGMFKKNVTGVNWAFVNIPRFFVLKRQDA